METTAQHYLWLYRHIVVKGTLIVSPSYTYVYSKSRKEDTTVFRSGTSGMLHPLPASKDLWDGGFLVVLKLGPHAPTRHVSLLCLSRNVSMSPNEIMNKSVKI